jgi:hypothetical protein
VNSFNLDYVDVYNLILDRGYLGALKYASEIEDKNFRLASEIDQIVSELYVIASRPFNVRYAQTSIQEYPTFDSYSTPVSPRSNKQSYPFAPSGTFGVDPLGGDSDNVSVPEGMPEPVGSLSSAATGLGYVAKLRYFRQTIANWVTKGQISQKLADYIVELLETRKAAGKLTEETFDAIKPLLQERKIGPLINLLQGSKNSIIRNTAKGAGKVAEIIAAAGKSVEILKPISNFLGKFTKYFPYLAVLFDAYDIFTDYDREGFSARVTCKIISAILGISSMIAIVEPPLAAILAALWLASSIGCGFIPQSNKFGEEYKNLTQEAIDEAKQTVTFESLPKHDQDLVDDLLKSSDENSIIEKIRNLRDSKKFEKPIQTLALIQKEHASWQPKIVPAG